ncbi:hypothetical protein V7128_02085 [Neobacillus vireti]|uniref:hypothetical protein n=1 Tax=Neobacillus vireti TaxID=220686 RepID=UPI002FFFD30A
MNNSKLVGRKVFGQWGIGGGWSYGIITEVDTTYNEIIVKWEDDGEIDLGERFYEIKDLIIADEDTDLDSVGVYVLPEENPETMEVKVMNGYYLVDLENGEVYNSFNGAQLTEQERIKHIINIAKRIQKIRNVYKNKIKKTYANNQYKITEKMIS